MRVGGGAAAAVLAVGLLASPVARAEERVEFYPVPKTSPSVYSLETDD